jgi:hypothetical protein
VLTTIGIVLLVACGGADAAPDAAGPDAAGDAALDVAGGADSILDEAVAADPVAEAPGDPMPDEATADPGAPDEGVASDPAPEEAAEDVLQCEVDGAVEAYGQCDTTCDCAYGLACVGGRTDPKYGQCLPPCQEDGDCPASPTGNPVGCHQTEKTCLSLCGTHGGTCPDWLECVGLEMCLPPSATSGTKTAAQFCTSHDECADGASCVEGQYTPAHCNPPCKTNADCNVDGATNGQCTAVGGTAICLWMCGMMGGQCPVHGDLKCNTAVCQ